MKTKKFLFAALAALVAMTTFTACGDDEKDDNGGDINFADYSSCVDMTYRAMLQKYGSPAMQFANFYIYENLKGDKKTEGITFAVNEETQTIYMVMQTLKEGAFKEADVKKYLSSKFTSYGSSTVTDEEEGITVTTYYYGNTKNEEDATLYVAYSLNSVTYTNPTNVPVAPESDAFLELEPIEIVDQFMGESIADVLDENEGKFLDMDGTYLASVEDAYYVYSFGLTASGGTVNKISLLYNEELSDADIVAYYQEAGYTCVKTGKNDDELDTYTFTNDAFVINYCDLVGQVTYRPYPQR